jgi:hypothetical protein
VTGITALVPGGDKDNRTLADSVIDCLRLGARPVMGGSPSAVAHGDDIGIITINGGGKRRYHGGSRRTAGRIVPYLKEDKVRPRCRPFVECSERVPRPSALTVTWVPCAP